MSWRTPRHQRRSRDAWLAQLTQCVVTKREDSPRLQEEDKVQLASSHLNDGVAAFATRSSKCGERDRLVRRVAEHDHHGL